MLTTQWFIFMSVFSAQVLIVCTGLSRLSSFCLALVLLGLVSLYLFNISFWTSFNSDHDDDRSSLITKVFFSASNVWTSENIQDHVNVFITSFFQTTRLYSWALSNKLTWTHWCWFIKCFSKISNVLWFILTFDWKREDLNSSIWSVGSYSGQTDKVLSWVD